MKWNYRVMVRDTAGGKQYAIHEVYYSDTGDVISWTEKPAEVSDTDYDGEGCQLGKLLAIMTEATGNPILDYHTGKPVSN